jgi:cell division protein FtsB
MKILAAVLGALILLIQYPLWLGKGGWMRAWQIEQDFNTQKNNNIKLEVRNAGLSAEVTDLKTGTEAIEERARYELGLVRGDEIFFQIEEKDRGQTPISGSKPSGAK